MKNKENFPKVANEQIENIDGYPEYSVSDDVFNQIDKEFDIEPENSSDQRLNEDADEDSEWKEMNFDLVDLGDDIEVSGSELDDEK